MSDAQQLLEAVRARTEGTPYTVTPTERGFDVGIDFPDYTWHRMLFDQHVSRAWTYHVVVDEPTMTIRVTDEESVVRWKGGGSRAGIPIPVISHSSTRNFGRIQKVSMHKTISLDGSPAPRPSDFTFSSAEGRELIRGPARELGWTEKMGGAEKTGIVVAIGALALAVVVGILLVVLALTGAL